MDPYATTPNVIDDHVDELPRNRLVHRGREPLETSMSVSRWVRDVVEGKEVGEGFRCWLRLFYTAAVSLEYVLLRLFEG